MEFGLLGEKLSHSLSPLIHKMFFEKYGQNYDYHCIPLPKEQLEGYLKNCLPKNFVGLNVTVPCHFYSWDFAFLW